MSDDYIPWWVPADDPRRRGPAPAAEVVAPEPVAVEVVEPAAAEPVAEPAAPEPAPDAADVLIEPTTPAQVEAARDYIASQGSE